MVSAGQGGGRRWAGAHLGRQRSHVLTSAPNLSFCLDCYSEMNSLRLACGEPPPSEREALSAPSLRELSAKLTEGVLKLWIVVKKSQLKTGCRFVKKSAARFIDFAVIYT